MKPEKCAPNLKNRTIAHSLHHVEHSEDWKNTSGFRVEVPDKRGPCGTMNGEGWVQGNLENVLMRSETGNMKHR
jgi:hypothetical protein